MPLDARPAEETPLARLRRDHREHYVYRWYDGRLHYALLTLISWGMIGAAATLAFGMGLGVAAAALLAPLYVALVNLGEYAMHRWVMHYRVTDADLAFLPGPARRVVIGFCQNIYRRHAQMHHKLYRHDSMHVEHHRDLELVALNWRAFILYNVVFFGGAALLIAAAAPAAGLWFAAVAWFYYWSYELQHMAFHAPEGSWLARSRIVRALARQHTIHHRPTLTAKRNFNATLPLCDFLFGTRHRDGAET